jgi:cell division protease FtsH
MGNAMILKPDVQTPVAGGVRYNMSLAGSSPAKTTCVPVSRFPAPAKPVPPTDGTRGDEKADPPATIPPGRTWLAFLFILLANYLLMRILFPSPEAPVVPYTLFKEEVGKGNVEAVYSRGEAIEGRFKTPVILPPSGIAPPGESRSVTIFKTTLPSFLGPGLEALLIAHGVEISAKPIQSGGSPWATLLIDFGPAILIIAFYVWLFRRAAQQGGGMGGALMGIGRSKARRYDKEQDTKVTFDDVAGIDEAENELVEIVDFTREVHPFGRYGSQGRPAGRCARHRKDVASEGGCRRGRRAILLD